MIHNVFVLFLIILLLIEIVIAFSNLLIIFDAGTRKSEALRAVNIGIEKYVRYSAVTAVTLNVILITIMSLCLYKILFLV